MKRIAAAIVLFLWSGLAIAGWLPLAYSSAQQAAFFAAAGSDSNPCTQASPCQTIARANAISYLIGATINFNGGDTFTGSIILTTTNVRFGNITVQSYGSGQATISSGNSAACVTATNVPAVSITSIVCTGGGNLTNTTAGIAIINSQAGNTKLAGPIITNVTASGYGYNCISIEGTNGTSGFNNIIINSDTIHDCTGNSTDSFGTSGIQIFSKTGNASGTTTPSHTNITISNNTLFNLTGKTGGTNWLGSGITVSQASTFTIQNNVVHDFGVNSNTFDPVGIWAYDAIGCTIQFNEVYNGLNVGNGFDLDAGAVNCVVQYNWAHDNAGFNYLAANVTGYTVWGNNTFRFNIGQNGGLGEFGFFFTVNATGQANIYNNTLTNFAIGKVFNRGIDSATITAVVANNIIAGVGGNLLSITTPGSINFTGNDYYTYGQAFSIAWNGTTYSSFAAWQTATGQEKISAVNVGLTSNPSIYVPGGGFINGGNGYVPANLMAYNLQSGSPMVGAGLNLTTQFGINPGSTDYYGVAISAASLPVGAAVGDFTSFAASSTAATNFLARISGFNKLDNVNYNSWLSGSSLDGDLALMSAKYMLAAPNAAAYVLNLVGTSFPLTIHGSPVFTARGGVQGDGVSAYLDTGFTTDANFTQNSATIAVYCRTVVAPVTNFAEMGNSSATMYNEIANVTTNGTFVAVNEGGAFNGYNISQIVTGAGNSKGYLLAQRTGAAIAGSAYNGTQEMGGTTTEVSGSLSGITTMTILGFNAPPVNSFSPDQLSSAMIGSGAISAKRTYLRDISFMAAYGIN